MVFFSLTSVCPSLNGVVLSHYSIAFAVLFFLLHSPLFFHVTSFLFIPVVSFSFSLTSPLLCTLPTFHLFDLHHLLTALSRTITSSPCCPLPHYCLATSTSPQPTTDSYLHHHFAHTLSVYSPATTFTQVAETD